MEANWKNAVVLDVVNTEDGKVPIKEEARVAFQEAFHCFDWNRNGKISHGSLQCAMRRAGINPTDVEVHDMINKIDNGSGVLDFEDFLLVMAEKNRETDIELHFKDTFRAFSKDEDGKDAGSEIENTKLIFCQAASLRRN